MKRQHPVIAVKYAVKNIWLLIFPLLRGLLTLQFSLEQIFVWLQGAWFDILIILLIIAIGIWRWRYTLFSISDSCFHYRSGKFLRISSTIPFCSISTVSCVKSPVFRLMKGVRVNIDTNSGSFKGADIQLIMRRGDSDILLDALAEQGISEETYIYKPKFWSTLFFSFAFSSTLSGALYAAALFSETGRIIDAAVLTEQINNATEILPIKISPYAIALSLIVIASWMLSFIINVVKYSAFTLKKEDSFIRINTGIITLRRHHINPLKINYTDIRQNLITKICRVTSVSVNCSGYGKSRKEIPVFVPITTKSRMRCVLGKIFPNLSVAENTLHPRRTALGRYIAVPLLSITFFICAAYFSARINKTLSELIFFAALMAAVPYAIMLFTRVAAYLCDGCGLSGNEVILRCSPGLSLRTIVIPTENIARIVLRQSLFQRLSRNCDIVFFARSERRSSYKVRSVRLRDAYQFLQKIGFSRHHLQREYAPRNAKTRGK